MGIIITLIKKAAERIPAAVRTRLIAGIAGAMLGAGAACGICLWINHGNTTTQRAVVAAYQSALADRDGQLELLDSQLRDARALAQQDRRLREQLTVALREHLGIVGAARGDYERGLANLKFAAKIFDILKRHYSQDH